MYFLFQSDFDTVLCYFVFLQHKRAVLWHQCCLPDPDTFKCCSCFVTFVNIVPHHCMICGCMLAGKEIY